LLEISAPRRRLGRTDLEICRIGIGGGNQLSSADLAYAVDQGVNFLFHSTDLHALTYANSAPAIRRLCGRGSHRRSEIVLATVSYVCDAEKLGGILLDQLIALNIDYVDVFMWGWVTRQNQPSELVTHSRPILCEPDGLSSIFAARMATVAGQVSDHLRSRGYARYLGISTHDRAIAAELAVNPLVDVVMFRYNIAHRGAEADLLTPLSTMPHRPGTVAFNGAHLGLRMLSADPPGLPPGRYQPTVGDLYRFVLDHATVDVLLTGPSKREHVDASLMALNREPLSPKLRHYLESFGDLHTGRFVVA
jgi:predicted aldo/keto reductase-like oxidoreductase